MKYLFTLLCFLSFQLLTAQQTPFNRGVNLSNWFQASSAQQIQFSKFTKQDFENIQSLGCDVIRLPINIHEMTDGAPDYIIDPLLLNFLDYPVSWAEELGLHLILDNHSFDPLGDTHPEIHEVLEKVWIQMANHYKDAYQNIYYEILNEPHGIEDSLWNPIQQEIVNIIRTIDQNHTIIVGGANWNSFHNLHEMPVYNDNNLIYTFHFYDPFLFTHQGATWVEPSMEDLASVPFPYVSAEMPPLPPNLAGTWIGSAYNNYDEEGLVVHVQELLDIAIQFRNERNVPIYCGEFGVYIPNSGNEDRVFWYEQVRTYLEQHNISWTTWDYQGGFGLFEPGGADLFDHDLNTGLLQALGLNVPPQSPFVIKPDSVGFFIYSDYIAEKIEESSYGSGAINFYDSEQPNNGDYCLSWKNAAQYDAIGFDFKPDKDMSYLESHNFALDFLVRGDSPLLSFDLRFVDTKTDIPEDHPWRIRVTIDNSDVDWDSRWHHLHLPLEAFVEGGSWDNNMWYDPQGDFDWTAIDRFEIVAEQWNLLGSRLWFDNIQVTDLDTAMVYDTSEVLTSIAPVFEVSQFLVFPNPVTDQLIVKSPGFSEHYLELIDISGKLIQHFSFEKQLEIDVSSIPVGIYFLKILEEGKLLKVEKVVVMRE